MLSGIRKKKNHCDPVFVQEGDWRGLVWHSPHFSRPLSITEGLAWDPVWKLITAEGVIFGLEADDGSTYVMLCAQLPRQVVLSFQALLLVPLLLCQKPRQWPSSQCSFWNPCRQGQGDQVSSAILRKGLVDASVLEAGFDVWMTDSSEWSQIFL